MQSKSKFRCEFIFGLLLLAVGLNQRFAESLKMARIVNGSPESVGRVPYLVRLSIEEKVFRCGGTLVKPQYVVTAAHCVAPFEPKDLVVIGGVTLLSEEGIRREVSKIIVPEIYTRESLEMDIAVLKLSSPMSGPQIRTIKLCNRDWNEGTQAKVAGWGQVTRTSSIQNQMHSVILPLISRKKCQAFYGNRFKLKDSMACAGRFKGRGFCFGDSGGPLTFGGRLCGVVSNAVACNNKGNPGIYISVQKARGFLDRAMQQ